MRFNISVSSDGSLAVIAASSSNGFGEVRNLGSFTEANIDDIINQLTNAKNVMKARKTSANDKVLRQKRLELATLKAAVARAESEIAKLA